MFPIVFEIIYLHKGAYDTVIGVWLIRNLYQGKRMVDLVQTKNSKCSRDEVLTSYDQVNIRSEIKWRMREPKSPWIYSLFSFLREVFFIHFMNG